MDMAKDVVPRLHPGLNFAQEVYAACPLPVGAQIAIAHGRTMCHQYVNIVRNFCPVVSTGLATLSIKGPVIEPRSPRRAPYL